MSSPYLTPPRAETPPTVISVYLLEKCEWWKNRRSKHLTWMITTCERRPRSMEVAPIQFIMWAGCRIQQHWCGGNLFRDRATPADGCNGGRGARVSAAPRMESDNRWAEFQAGRSGGLSLSCERHLHLCHFLNQTPSTWIPSSARSWSADV